MVTPASVPNAAAEVRGGERYIRYNPTFLADAKSQAGTNWAVYAVMAHEIGHHLQGHTVKPGGSRPPIELEADEWSGWAMGKLGATLEEAQVVWSNNPNAPGSNTHPPARERLSAIEKGWNRASSDGPVEVPDTEDEQVDPSKPLPNPTPQPQQQFVGECYVQGEHAYVGADNNLYNSTTRMLVAQMLPPRIPGCVNMIRGVPSGWEFCLNAQYQVYNTTNPMPVGYCKQY